MRRVWNYVPTEQPCIIFHFAAAPSGLEPQHYRGFTITLRHTTLGKTPLDGWSVRCRDIYLTTHNTHNRHIFMSPTVFEPAIPANEGPNTHALDRAATGIDCCYVHHSIYRRGNVLINQNFQLVLRQCLPSLFKGWIIRHREQILDNNSFPAENENCGSNR